MAGELTAAPAAQPDPVELLEAELFAEAAYRQHGVDLRGFEPAWLARRLVGELAQGAGTISGLQSLMLRDAGAAQALFRRISDARSAFFTAPSSFMALRCAILPLLRSVSWPVIWVAEASDPAFLIQLAVMLDEEGVLARTQIFVTNAHEGLLSATAALRLPAAGLQECDARHMKGGGARPLSNYGAVENGELVLAERLREHFVWSQHHLASDASFNECHVIICQRPMMQFSPALRQKAVQLFSGSLCNFGILQLEPAPQLASHEVMRGFASILGEQGVFKRLPGAPRATNIIPMAYSAYRAPDFK